MSKDYYKALGIEKTATPEDIKKAFKKLAMQHHPDRQGGNEAKFKEINEAYQVLGDKDKRAKYDQFGSDFEQQGGFGGGGSWEDVMNAFRNGQGGQFGGGFGGVDLGDIFGDMFGFGGGGARGASARRGRDIQVDVELDFKEAAFGVERELSLRKQTTCDACKGSGAEPGSKIDDCHTCHGQGQVVQQQQTFLGNVQTVATCPTCHGRGKFPSKKCTHCNGQGVHTKSVQVKVKIPAGIDNGQSIRLTGHGESAPHQGTPGDLYVAAHIRASKEFQRDGYNVYTNSEVSFTQAVLGDTIEVETIDGVVKMVVPEGTEAGALIRLKGKGISELGREHNRGDHYVRIKIRVPKKVNKDVRKKLEELGKDL